MRIPIRRLLLAAACLVLFALPGLQGAPASPEAVQLEALMPPWATSEEDSYLCTTIKLPDEPMQLVGFEPLAHDSVVHHILLFGCKVPAEPDKLVWDCKMKFVCGGGGGDSVLYGWGRNAPAVSLPPATGFAVGPGSSINVLVLQVHYLQPRPMNDGGSGLRLTLSHEPSSRAAGMLAFASTFTIPPHTPEHFVPDTCCVAGFEPAWGLAARVHTHALGRSVTLDRLRAEPGAAWERLATQDPLQPQGFYDVAAIPEVLPGDTLRATCVFDSSGRDQPVAAGHGSRNEMCNLYLLSAARLPSAAWCANDRLMAPAHAPGAVQPGWTARLEHSLWHPPADLGQAGGVAADGRGRIWSFTRRGRIWGPDTFDSVSNAARNMTPIGDAPVMLLDETSGSPVAGRALGAGLFVMPHGITPAPGFPDIAASANRSTAPAVWVTDVALHQALLMAADGSILRSLGKRGVPGNGTGPELCKPTHVAAARDGTVYIADGYCAARVAVFAPDGTFQRSIVVDGESAGGVRHGSGVTNATSNSPADKNDLNFLVPHAVVLNECSRKLYVADREHGRVVAVDADTGKLAGSWSTHAYGLPYGLALGPYGGVHVLAWDRDDAARRAKALGASLLDPWRTEANGTVADAVAAANTHLLVLGPQPGEFAVAVRLPGLVAPHDLTLVPEPGELTGPGERRLAIVVAEAAPEGSRLVKFVLRGADHQTVEGGGVVGGDPAAQDGAHHGASSSEAAGALEASHAGHGQALVDLGGGSSASTSGTKGDDVVVSATDNPKPHPGNTAAERHGNSTAVATARDSHDSHANTSSGQDPPSARARLEDAAAGTTTSTLRGQDDGNGTGEESAWSSWPAVATTPPGLSRPVVLAFLAGVSLTVLVGFARQSGCYQRRLLRRPGQRKTIVL